MKYSVVQRILHWLIAAMVIGVLAIGIIFARLEFEGALATFGQATTNMLYKYHKTFGVLILGLMVVRIVVRLTRGKPDYAQPLTRFERIASEAAHGLIYVCLIAMPILGWLATAASGFPVEFFDWRLPGLVAKDKELGAILFQAHGAVGFLLLLLILVHIGAALKHALIKRDGLLGRML